MKETELGELVIEWLSRAYPQWTVFQEIRASNYAGSSVADIVCLNEENSVWVIELKTSLNLAVIRQAYTWDVDCRSVAVLQPKRQAARDERRWWYMHLKTKMAVGTIEVSSLGSVSEIFKAPDRHLFEPTFTSKKIIDVCRSGLTEGFSQAGNSKGGYWTTYKESIKAVKEYIQKHPGCGAGDIVGALGKLHYANKHSARTNLVKNLKSQHSADWCRVEKKGTYDTFFIKESNK